MNIPGGAEYLAWQNTFTPDQKHKITSQLRAIATSTHAVSPLVCKGLESCAYRATCPLARAGNTPNGLQCPLEQQLIFDRLQVYKERLGIDRFNPVDNALVDRIVTIELLEYRINAMLATTHQDVFIDEIVGASMQGQILTRVAAHPAFKVLEKLSLEKTELFTQLVGTRRERYRKEAALKAPSGNDFSSTVSNLAKALREVGERQKALKAGEKKDA